MIVITFLGTTQFIYRFTEKINMICRPVAVILGKNDMF